ncbi:MAG: prepilin-type N-terminal cleavage/methylation domain-containing protein [Planctomycetales bacterium]|nr:prepilin-type N-terminal cleavage/methylation domain-containing protein [Planctomycetales bacterium]
MKFRRRTRRRGFSLMEVMAAIIIIAAVATATVSSLVALRGKSQAKIDQQNIAELNGKVQAYYMEFGRWPDTNLARLYREGYTDKALQATPYGGRYTFDATTQTVVNTYAP